jgi:ABC-type transport system involved in multi-copper enzyme maturation permease subunit
MNRTILAALFRKEWRQLVASKAALLSGAILPVIMLGFVPLMLASLARGGRPSRPLPLGMQFGLFAELGGEPRHLAGAILPILVSLVGLVIPTLLATHLVISEREQRTLELVVAWPVRLGDVLVAKLLATCAAAALLTLPFLALDMVVLVALSAASIEQVIGLPLVLGAALALSTVNAIAISLASKDFRTANNLGGVFIAPMLLVSVVATVVLPGGLARALGMALVHGVLALGVLRHVTRRATFERLFE